MKMQNVMETKFTPDEIKDLKKRFAELITKYKQNREEVFASDEFKAMLKYDTPCMLYVSTNWYNDDDVINVLSKLPDDNRILSKADILDKLMSLHDRTLDDSLKYKCLTSYAEIAGHTAKAKDIDERAVSNVILVNDNGTTQQWEDKLSQQQQQLQERGRKLLEKGGINVN